MSKPVVGHVDDEDGRPPGKAFPLQARPEPTDDSNRSAIEVYLKKYPLRQQITPYTLDEQNGPFYAARYSTRTITQLLTALTFGVALIGAAILLLRRRSDTN